MIRALSIVGTRPEAIKMAPVIKQLARNTNFESKVCLTGQHLEMLVPVLELFQITADINLKVMTPEQSLTQLTTMVLHYLEPILLVMRPDIVLVHGDTTTTLAATLAASYQKIPVAHVEAGLRTGDINFPWPEEINRKLVGALATLHFSPTVLSRDNLIKEGVSTEHIYVTGNTVVDALFGLLNDFWSDSDFLKSMGARFPFLNADRRMILVTGHRRESFGDGLRQICESLVFIAKAYSDVDIVYPVHLNPNVQATVYSLLQGYSNIHLMAPVDYLSFIYLMKFSYLILTDSGGLQEEAASLGKPVLVMRDKTERMEAIMLGIAKLVGTKANIIIDNVVALLTNKALYKKMSHGSNIFGDGKAAFRIVSYLESLLSDKVTVVGEVT